MLGQYRKIFEPLWNVAIASLLSNPLSHQDRFAVAGHACLAAHRGAGPQRHATGFLLISKEMQDKHGGNPHLPVEAIEALQRGEIALDHDPDYVKAQLTRQLMVRARLICHQDWDIIENPTAYPFINYK